MLARFLPLTVLSSSEVCIAGNEIKRAVLHNLFVMSSHNKSPASWRRQTSQSSISTSSAQTPMVTIVVWLLRFALAIVLLLCIMPLALLLTPWWICLQPFERALPNLMYGYERLVTWPLTLSKNIRSYQQSDRFIDKLKY